jgi:uncharacterized protein (DUF488 family)
VSRTGVATEILTIGHSTHTWDRFVALLHGAGVTAIADVRSSPYSGRAPQFSRDALVEKLREAGIAYVFLGKQLGGRPANKALYCDGVADYERMAEIPEFAAGLDRVIEGAGRYRIALMCAEREPLECHRCLLVGRRLRQRGVEVGHILADGTIQPHQAIEARLLSVTGISNDDMFAPPAERLSHAYRARARKVAFAEHVAGTRESVAAD